LVTALAVVACAVPASATIAYYADVATFDADNVSAQTLSFDGLGVGAVFLTTTLDGFTFSSINTVNNNLTVLGNPGGSWPNSAGAADLLAQYAPSGFSNGTIVIAVPANVFSFAFVTSYEGAISDDLNIVVTAGSAFPTTALNVTNAPRFIGARSDQAITSITLSKPSGSPNFGEGVQLGAFLFDMVSGSDTGGGSTPEPGTLILIGIGLIGFVFLRRRFAI
jgi:hypothetical protein